MRKSNNSAPAADPWSRPGALPRTVLIVALAALVASCAFKPAFVPEAREIPEANEAATTETGSRIPRGKSQTVRDSPQNVDVFSEQDLEKQRPVNTRDAVRRATRGF